MIVEYHRTRTGPNYFVGCYKGMAKMYLSPKDCWRMLGCAKYTEGGKALKEWCEEVFDDDLPKPDLDMAAIKAEGFGPEAHAEDEDPTANTKMVI